MPRWIERSIDMKTTSTLAALAVLAPFAAAQTYTGTGGVIPDNAATPGVFTSSIVVTDVFDIADITLDLTDFNHTFVGDLVITLSNGTTTVDIVNRIGRVTTGFGDSSNFAGDYRFSNNGADLWAVAAGLTDTDDVIPQDTYGVTGAGSGDFTNALSAFFGSSSAGTWTLTISDNATFDTGSLGGWILTLTPVPSPSTLALVGLGGLAAARRRRA